MKKTMGIILAVTLVLSLGTASIFASGFGERANQNRGEKYVNSNADGICDNYDASSKCENRGAKFVDEDGDGVCDNFAEENCQSKRKKQGDGYGYHRENHKHGQCNR